MNVHQFHTLVATQPFRPFTLLTVDGREYRVDHPENYWIPPTMPVIHIAWEDRVSIIDVGAIASIEHEQATAE